MSAHSYQDELTSTSDVPEEGIRRGGSDRLKQAFACLALLAAGFSLGSALTGLYEARIIADYQELIRGYQARIDVLSSPDAPPTITPPLRIGPPLHKRPPAPTGQVHVGSSNPGPSGPVNPVPVRHN